MNIPTAELESMAEQRDGAAKALLYPRDPSLDPQLVWRGKDEQDQADLAVPLVPLFIQEQISPRAIIEELRKRTEESVGPGLFDNFNGLSFEQRVDFYQHRRKWSNRMILGDSLMVMASLAEKEGLKGKVQMIYLDPPYGIKFGSNWQVSTRKRDVRDGRADDATRQPEQVRAFRDTWELGIHSYLSYLRDRVTIARDLLTDSGSIFIQIGDANVHLVRSVLDEVFGSGNFVSVITVQKMAGLSAEFINGAADYIVWYVRNRETAKYRQLFQDKLLGVGHGSGARYDQIISPSGERRRAPKIASDLNKMLSEGWEPCQLTTLTTFGSGGSSFFPFDFQGKTYFPATGKGWLTTLNGMRRLDVAHRIMSSGATIRYLRLLNDFPSYELNNVWTDIASPPDVVYAVQTSPRLVQRCMLMCSDPGDLVLDPTCGSGTTAFVAEQWGRRWITIDTSRVALALARTRLMSARFPFYILADSPEGVRKEHQLAKTIPPDPLPAMNCDVDKGFIYEQVPHVTLKSIANNPDIREAMTREEIRTAIARHAETELLYDKPYEEKDIVRVSGPFTVESLSPHRMLPAADGVRDPEPDPAPDSERFISRILDNLRKAGVQNTVKGERLDFASIELWPGAYIQAVGDYNEADKAKRAAICIGPEYGTVGPELIREAAKEASKICDLLIVCGFAFEAIVGEESSKLGRMQVLRAKMNPDLSMGDELLKKTGAGNLFMVFGEPDIEIRKEGTGEYVAQIRGLDIYDPTTGAVKSHDTDDIACWFIDTNYDEESFFVRHAYFVGAGDPYEKLRKALRADIDESAWQTLYRTTSRPFKKPSTGKIAIKVINHYGDEVLKAYAIS
ncbi:MAG TPA: site-specific DNA-methyltransferase [Candidatus Binatia bacterium]|nr:site-specific DNA-methyltransferase [Candidatus Binatia bacterium]